MRFSSGVTDQYLYFVAVDSTDFTTRETGFSSFTVYRSRDGAAAAAMTTPTINETDSSNMAGVYELLLDEDMTIGAGNDTEEMVFHITHAGMAPVTRTIELYRSKITAGYTLGVESDGDLTKVNLADTVTTNTDLVTAVAVRTEMDSNSTQLADIVADTNELQGDDVPTLIAALPTAAENRTEMDSNSTQLADIVADTNELQGDNVPGLIAALPTAVENRTEMDSNSTKLADIVADTNELQSDDVPGLIAALNDPTAAANADAVWDEILTAGTHNIATSAGRRLRTLQDFGVYEGGAIWIDTVNGAAGTTDYENGTVNNPVDSIADALILAASVSLSAFHVLPGSSITLAASADNYEFRGYGYSVALNGQSLSGTSFENATITGNDDGSNGTATRYIRCSMGSNTLGKHTLYGCQFTGDIILAEAADYFWDSCYSGVAGTGTPSVDLQSAAETKNLSIRHYSGGMEFKNFGAGSGTHTASIEGFGQVVINANCAAGTIAIRGNFTVTDNASGAVTLSDDARIDVDQINAEVDTAFTTQIADSVPADGTIPTREQAIYMINQFLLERAVSGTTVTVKKVDGSTGLMTLTLNDGTTPTSITRAT